MKNSKLFIITIIVIVSIIIFNDNSFAKDYASFESFYKESSSLTSWILGGALAVAGVALVIFTGGGGAPFVASIGSSIGGLMGLSGAAATSAGLAWLGGGALAAGGFGVMGGTVLLTAVFEGTLLAGSQVYESYTINKNYTQLCESVKDYPTLPPIVNISGPNEVEEVVKYLKDHYDLNQAPSSNTNKSAIRYAKLIAEHYLPENDAFYKIGYDKKIRRERLRIYTLQAILAFMDNDYESAFSKVSLANYYYTNDDGKDSVLDFIYAVSGLMCGKCNLRNSIFRFKSSVYDESDSPLIPLLFSIYLSRVGAMDLVSSDYINELYGLTFSIDNKKIKEVVLSQLITAMLSKIYKAQGAIRFAGDNIENLKLDEAINTTKIAYDEYKSFLLLAKSVISNIIKSESDIRDFLYKAESALYKYEQEDAILAKTIQELKDRHKLESEQRIVANSNNQSAGNSQQDSDTSDTGVNPIVLAISVLAVVFLFLKIIGIMKKKYKWN